MLRRLSLSFFTKRPSSLFLIAAAVAVPSVPATADYRVPTAQEVPGWFPPGLTMPMKAKTGAMIPGSWVFTTFREPEMRLVDGGKKIVLKVETNGIFDDRYPYSRVIDTVLAKVCGIAAPQPAKQGVDERGVGGRMLLRMYKSKSLTPQKRLGGNAGSTFRKMAVETANGCKITMVGQGARWHYVTTTIEAATSGFKRPAIGAIPTWFPPGLAKKSKSRAAKENGFIWEFNSWRKTVLSMYDRRSRIVLRVSTNGLYEEKWPYTRIIDRVLAKVCGIPEPQPVAKGMNDRGVGAQLLRAVYKSRSRIKGENLGGNAGETFDKQVSETRNGCTITMRAAGARWHIMTTTITAAK